MIRIFVLLFLFGSSLTAQCDLDRHNTDMESGWISCSTSMSPNPNRGIGHWIMYDFSFDYMLEQVHVWNNNHPDYLDRGANQVVIDISDDGINWSESAAFSVPMASGDRLYSGINGPTLNQRARYMLVTILSNHGGDCFAIGEIRVGVEDEIECQDSYTISGEIPNRKYYANESINTAGQITANSVVHMQAGNQELLNQGFEATQSAEIEIEMGPCDQ